MKTQGSDTNSSRDLPVKAKKSSQKYLPEIDLLKAAAALLVILIHVSARYKGQGDLYFYFWDYIHFAVSSFVLASGFLFENGLPEIYNLSDYWSFFVKKFKRIVVPYYIFAIIWIITVSLFSSKELLDFLNPKVLLQTVLLWGGVGNNWIPLLFISIMAVVGIERLLIRKIPYIPQIIFFGAASISIYQMTRSTDAFARFDNLFGWLVVFYVGRFLFHRFNFRAFISIIIASGILWIVLFKLFNMMGLDNGIFANKYPPNFYYISYELMVTVALFGLLYLKRDIFQKSEIVWKITRFISANSYEIFFYHLLIMHFWKVKINIFVDWAVITALTISAIYIFRTVWGRVQLYRSSSSKK